MFNNYNTPSDLCSFVEQNEVHGAATLNKRSQHITPSHREFDSLLSLCMECCHCQLWLLLVQGMQRMWKQDLENYKRSRQTMSSTDHLELAARKRNWLLNVLVNFNFWFWGDHNGGACFIISITSTHSPSQQWLNMNKNEDAIWYKPPEQ